MHTVDRLSSGKKKVKQKRGRPRKMKLDLVLESAMQAYWHGDPKQISVNMICKTAGISKPSLYREFKNEDSLMCAALERYIAQIIPEIFQILTQKISLSEIIQQLIDYICDEPKFEKGCLFQKLYYGQNDLGPLTLARVRKIRLNAIESYETCLRAHLGQDTCSHQLNIKYKALYLFEQVLWAVNLRSLGMSNHQVKQLLTLALSSFLPSHIRE